MLGVSLSRGSSAASHSLISLNGHYAASLRSSVWTGAPARTPTSSRCPPLTPFSLTSVPAGGRREPCCPLEDETEQRMARRKDSHAANESIRADNLRGGAESPVLWTLVPCFQVIPSNNLITEKRRSEGCYTKRQPLNPNIVQPAICIQVDSNKLHDGSQIIHQNNNL